MFAGWRIAIAPVFDERNALCQAGERVNAPLRVGIIIITFWRNSEGAAAAVNVYEPSNCLMDQVRVWNLKYNGVISNSFDAHRYSLVTVP